MTAHVTYTAIDSQCATRSQKVLSLIRGEIGFDGLLMTDDISMQALGGPLNERCATSLAAGCDLLLHCNGELEEMRQVAEVGAMTAPAQRRADAAIAARRTPSDFDAAEAEAELANLVGENSDA